MERKRSVCSGFWPRPAVALRPLRWREGERGRGGCPMSILGGRGDDQRVERVRGRPDKAGPWHTVSRARGCPRNQSWGLLGGARLGQWRSWSPSRSEGGERGSGRGQRRASRVAREWPSRAVLGHATTGSKEREGGGGRPCSMSRTPRRPRGTRSRRPRSTGASGRGRLQCKGAL